jgi:two-component system, NarL family, invasion response regulator UvrY
MPPPPVLILSMCPADQFAARAMAAGASGYVEKGSDAEDILTAVRTLLSGRKYVPPRLAALLHRAPGDSPHELLSDREYQVLRLIGSGKTVSEIAADLSLSVKTISTYRARILDKMGLRTNAELMRYALERKLIQ